jgi:small conductance mechanosensitive channel
MQKNILNWLLNFATKGWRILLIVIISWIAYQFIKVVIKRSVILAQKDLLLTPEDFEKRVKTLTHLLESLAKVTILIIAFMMILGTFEINLAPLLASAGIAGLAIGFGAQNLIRDLISGFFIIFENQYNVGDVIQIEDARGKVEKMSIRATYLRDLEGNLHIIPNGEIKKVTNISKSFSRALVDIEVAYKEDLDKVIDVLKDECEKMAQDNAFPDSLRGKPEVLGVEKLGSSGITIRILTDTEPGKQWEVAREMRKRIKKRLDKEGIEIPFPQLTLWLGDDEIKEALKIKPPD